MKIEQLASLGVETGVTEEEKAELVEWIQRGTAGMTTQEKASTVGRWMFMAQELNRVLTCASSRHSAQPAQQSGQLQLRLE